MAHSLPRPNPSHDDGTKEGKTKEGSAQFIVKMSAFLLLPDAALNQHLQLDNSP